MSERDTVESRTNTEPSSTQDISRGKSFRYTFGWNAETQYLNDEYIQDFISENGRMYICIQSNIGRPPTESEYWQFLMEGERGASIDLQVGQEEASEERYLQKRWDANQPWENILNIEELRGPSGTSVIIEKNLKTNNIEYRTDDRPSSENKILVYKEEIKGERGDAIAKMYIANDGYLYVLMSGSTTPHRAGYVRGDKGDDGREIVLRIDNDKHLDTDESGTGTHLQWKYAGDEYKLWTNLIQINELVNIALLGIKLDYRIVEYEDASGVMTKFERISLSNWKVDYDDNGNLVLTDIIGNITFIDVPLKSLLANIYYDESTMELVFVFDTATGENKVRIDITKLFRAGEGIEITKGNYIGIQIDTDNNEVLSDNKAVLSVDSAGLKVTGVVDKLIKGFDFVVTPQSGQADIRTYQITAQDSSVYEARFPILDELQEFLALSQKVTDLEMLLGDINSILDNINGEII